MLVAIKVEVIVIIVKVKVHFEHTFKCLKLIKVKMGRKMLFIDPHRDSPVTVTEAFRVGVTID